MIKDEREKEIDRHRETEKKEGDILTERRGPLVYGDRDKGQRDTQTDTDRQTHTHTHTHTHSPPQPSSSATVSWSPPCI